MGAKKTASTWAIGSLALALAAPDPALAQGSDAGAVRAQLGIRARGEAWNWFGGEDGGRYGYLGSTLRAGLTQQGSDFGWQIELAAPLLLGLPDDAVAPAPRGQLGLGATYRAENGDDDTAAGLFLKQAWVRLGPTPGSAGHAGRLGRLEFFDGAETAPQDPTLAAIKRDRVAHRLLGNFGWSHAGRSFDGLHYAYGGGSLTATALIARPTQGVFRVDGWPGLDVGVAYGALGFSDRSGSPADARLFLLGYLDSRDDAGVVKTDNRPLAARQADDADVEITTAGGHYVRLLEIGGSRWDVLLWGAVQGGRWGDLDHRAWAGTAEVGVQPGFLPALRPWLRVGHFRSSGDSDPADDRHGTFFQVLPTPRIYARFPFYNLMNLRDTFASLTLRPAASLTLRADLRALDLDSAADLWYAGGGAFEGTSFGYAGRPANGFADLATLLDLSLDYRLSSRLTATLYGGHAWAGGVIESIYGMGDTGSLAYLELEYRR